MGIVLQWVYFYNGYIFTMGIFLQGVQGVLNMGIQQLATVIATAVREARSTVGMAERGVIAGDTVVTDRGTYPYEACCPINLYDGKMVWLQVTEDNNAVIIGE